MISNRAVKTILTAGKKYNEIDGAACASAYAELLKMAGFEVQIFVRPEPNNTITKSVRRLLPFFDKSVDFVGQDYQVVVVDTSTPDFVEEMVDLGKVVEVFDHHYDGNDLWKEMLGDKAHIEDVGSCATLIYEEITRQGDPEKCSRESLMLLVTAIIANTLNLKAQATKVRDVDAYKSISQLVGLDSGWSKQYYSELDEGLLANPRAAVGGDVKTITINGQDVAISQMELWDGEEFMRENIGLIKKTFGEYATALWLYTSPCVAKGINYLYTESEQMTGWLVAAIEAEFIGEIGTTKDIWLRKEIIRELQKVI